MKNKPMILLGSGLLVTCAVLTYLIANGDEAKENNHSEKSGRSQTSPTSNTGNSTTGSSRSPRTSSRDNNNATRLAERFGESRTGLAKTVTFQLAGVFEDSLQLAEMVANLRGGGNLLEMTTRQTVDAFARSLDLSEEQKLQAAPIVEQAVQARFNAARAFAASMKDSPESMMELFLYGDALARGEITRDEYDTATGQTRASLGNISNAIIGRSPDSAMPLAGDDQFSNAFSAILTPEQREKMAANPPETPTRRGPGQNMPFQGGDVPVMELDQLDQTITSARKMTAGFQQVLQGMEGLQQNLGQE